MGVTKNGYYNDPNIGAAFENLGQMFAPPTAQDAYAAAKTAETRQKMDALSQYFAGTNDPTIDRDQLEKAAIGMGLYNPSQSYYSVDEGNKTSRANNADNNATTIKTNQADNARAFAEARYGAVSEGATLPELPESVASMFSLPATDTPFSGVVKVGEGEQAYMPQAAGSSGPPQVLKGTPKAPSGDQVFNYKRPDGVSGTGRYDPIQGKIVDTQTGAPIPEGAIKYSASLEGDSAGTGLAPTTANTTDANKQAAEDQITREMLLSYQRRIDTNPNIVGAAATLRGFVQDFGQTALEVSQVYSQDPAAAQQKINAALAQAQSRGYDPDIAAAEFERMVLAARLAKTLDPSGEINVKEYERNIGLLGGDALANQKSVGSKLIEFNNLLDAKGRAVNTLRNPGPTGATPPPAAGGEEVWVRGADGKLQRAK